MGRNMKRSCIICSRVFRSKQNLFNHLLDHTEEKPFPCSLCDKSFRQEGNRKNHMLTHSERRFECDQCGKRFPRSSKLQRHRSTVHAAYSSRPFPCDLCEKRFVTSGDFTNHMLSHTGEKPYKCDMCGKSFRINSHLTSHKKCHEPLEFGCDFCPAKFARKRQRQEHTLRVHIKPEKTHKCPVCSKAFLFKYELKLHHNSHTDQKRSFECSICSVRYKQRQSLALHRKRDHKTEELASFPCSHCPRIYASLNGRNYHTWSIHTREFPLQCVFCAKQYIRSHGFQHHLFKHTREKPYFCQLCENSFSLKQSLEDHFRFKHTLERPFNCGCGKAYASSRSLDYHRKMCCDK